MRTRYRITPEGRPPAPADEELARYRNAERLQYNYQRATQALHRRPLYKDPKAFLALLLIVLLAWFLSEVADAPSVVEPAQEQIHPHGSSSSDQ
jgi:hypothetical protein